MYTDVNFDMNKSVYNGDAFGSMSILHARLTGPQTPPSTWAVLINEHLKDVRS